MKSFASAAFFRIFDIWVRPQGALADDSHWSIEGADWTRSRHMFRSADYGCGIDVFIGEHPGRKPWKIMIVHETWWIGRRTDVARNGRWAQLMSGDRTAALAWFQAREELGPSIPRRHA